MQDDLAADDDLLQLIGEIYDAALDSALWPDVLKRIAGYTTGLAAALVSHDIGSTTGGFYYSWGDDPAYTKLYFEKYVRLNPTLPLIAMLGIGDTRAISDIIPFREFRKTRLYREWAQPQGYGDALLAVLDKTATSIAHLTTTHADSESPLAEGPRGRFRLLVPHVRRAVHIARTLERQTIAAATLAEAVDALVTGVIFVGRERQLVRANASARAMLEQADVLRATHGRIEVVSPVVRGELQDAIARADRGDGALGTRGIALPVTGREGEPYVIHVLPLTSGRRARASYAATAALFVHRADPIQPTPIETVAAHFRLTPAELRVLVGIVEVGGVPEVAPVLGVSETTVKTHLRHLFEKTGTSRQAELVRLIAGFTVPVR